MYYPFIKNKIKIVCKHLGKWRKINKIQIRNIHLFNKSVRKDSEFGDEKLKENESHNNTKLICMIFDSADVATLPESTSTIPLWKNNLSIIFIRLKSISSICFESHLM